MMQQLNSEKLLVEGCVEGSYEKVLQAFTLNKTVPSMSVAKGHSGRYDRSQQGLLAGAALSSRFSRRRRHCRLRRLFMRIDLCRARAYNEKKTSKKRKEAHPCKTKSLYPQNRPVTGRFAPSPADGCIWQSGLQPAGLAQRQKSGRAHRSAH